MSLSLHCFSIPGSDDALQLHQADSFTPQKGPGAPLNQHVASRCVVWVDLLLVTPLKSGHLWLSGGRSAQTPRTRLPNHWRVIIKLEDGAGKQEVAADSPTSVTCVQRETAAGSRFRPMYHPNRCDSWCLGREFAYYRPAGGLFIGSCPSTSPWCTGLSRHISSTRLSLVWETQQPFWSWCVLI